MVDPKQGGMRASDADRERVAQRLRTALDEGRLSVTEYDERLQGAYGATTLGELEPLTSDLPEPKPSPELVAREEQGQGGQGVARLGGRRGHHDRDLGCGFGRLG
ncbi:DUF1707 SHOCT-like domain-containing protein [Saccharopolyspora mangrovi]|uniref:DUF1707 domain-containing protein n=1 Tax=Saccharopolyspora mangrovi TaxID=3082379 RepID=A0ABU6AHT8_9PSEU|nr:DUF1707 domain-containing protein [Saccharopolyspora sp. S2-29]MEB3371139.1 DUF1707 domain-containing protein [Saccharopolyspora sp. S2-29]